MLRVIGDNYNLEGYFVILLFTLLEGIVTKKEGLFQFDGDKDILEPWGVVPKDDFSPIKSDV